MWRVRKELQILSSRSSPRAVWNPEHDPDRDSNLGLGMDALWPQAMRSVRCEMQHVR